jgi:predicted nucleic acid-binding protein
MTFVDSNVLIDILSHDPAWSEWSFRMLSRCSASGPLLINETVYAEISVHIKSQAELDAIIDDLDVTMLRIPKPALFVAGKAYLNYRQAGGIRTGVLPDFFIGAHAQVTGLPILTRDARRYRSYFPDVDVIAPDEAT